MNYNPYQHNIHPSDNPGPSYPGQIQQPSNNVLPDLITDSAGKISNRVDNSYQFQANRYQNPQYSMEQHVLQQQQMMRQQHHINYKQPILAQPHHVNYFSSQQKVTQEFYTKKPSSQQQQIASTQNQVHSTLLLQPNAYDSTNFVRPGFRDQDLRTTATYLNNPSVNSSFTNDLNSRTSSAIGAKVPVSNRPSGVARPVQKVFPQRRLTSTVSCDNINKQSLAVDGTAQQTADANHLLQQERSKQRFENQMKQNDQKSTSSEFKSKPDETKQINNSGGSSNQCTESQKQHDKDQDHFYPKKYKVQNNCSEKSGGSIKLKISLKGEQEILHRVKDKKKKKKKSSKNKDRDRHRSKDRNQESTSYNYKSCQLSQQEKTKLTSLEPSARSGQRNPYQLGFPQRDNVQWKRRKSVDNSTYQTNQQQVSKKSAGHYSQQSRQVPYSHNDLSISQKQHSSYTTYNQHHDRHSDNKSSHLSNQLNYGDTNKPEESKLHSKDFRQLMMQASRNDANTKYNRNQISSNNYISVNSKYNQNRANKLKSVHHQHTTTSHSFTNNKSNKEVRVRFEADKEELNIYSLRDLLYTDEKAVKSFDELVPGTKLKAKWPNNSKFYEAVVINPLAEIKGRRFRDRKPAPKPYQASISHNDHAKFNNDENSKGFEAYKRVEDRIKNRKRELKSGDDCKIAAKKRKKIPGLIQLESEESANESENEKRKEEMRKRRKDRRIMEERKNERRNQVESRFQQSEEAGPHNKVLSLISRIFDKIDALDAGLLNEIMSNDENKEYSIRPYKLISKQKLEELNEEISKLKDKGTLNQIPRKKAVKLLTYLIPVIRAGIKVKPLLENRNENDKKMSKIEMVHCSTEASLIAMNIMTAPNMSKSVYIDEVMERLAQFMRNQLNNTVYPEYDPVYKSPLSKKKEMTHSSGRMRRAHYKGTKNRRILSLYNKLNQLIENWTELVNLQPLTDDTVIKIAPVGVSTFFVENIKEIQLSAIRLTTCLFSKYEKHRKHIMDEIFQSMSRLPTSKRNLRSFKLTHAEEAVNSSDDEEEHVSSKLKSKEASNLQYIQMITALILHMIQSIIKLPQPIKKHLIDDVYNSDNTEIFTEMETANEIKMVSSYDQARHTAQTFLGSFLKKCTSKSDDTDFRPLFENFLHDLLNTVNKPEWPASEMLLTVLGRLLVLKFSNKQTEMSLRVASLDYLGVVAAKLRRDAITSAAGDATLQVKQLLKRLEESYMQNVDNQEELEDEENEEQTSNIKKKGLAAKTLKQKLQCLVLGYLRNNMKADDALAFALNFYVGQWHHDLTTEHKLHQDKLKKTGAYKAEEENEETKQLIRCQKKKTFLLKLSQAQALLQMSVEERNSYKFADGISQFAVQQEKSDKLALAVANEDATQMTRFLASSRSFSKSFDSYLTYILKVCQETSGALRTRAMKCLAEVVSIDPAIMTRDDISKGVRISLMDSSTNVREAAVDLIGKFIILKPELVDTYYDMLTARILDTGVSVRKRVIRILRDLCHEHPHLPQMTDACIRMIRRVNDEEGIKKLVHEVFMKMWFTPLKSANELELKKKALLITDIVAANRNRGYEWIEQLFKNLIDTPDENVKVETACQQIVDCLVQHIIILEDKDNGLLDYEKNNTKVEPKVEDKNNGGSIDSKQSIAVTKELTESSTTRSERLIATIQTLGYLAKIRPQYLVKHVMLLQPYLATSTKNINSDSILIVSGVCKILELSVPLMQRPSGDFLVTLEGEMMKIILVQQYRIVVTAVACLASVVNNFTNNYKIVWDCFKRMFGGMQKAREVFENKPHIILQNKSHTLQLFRAIFIVGHLSKTFNFEDENFAANESNHVKENVYECLFFFCTLNDGNNTTMTNLRTMAVQSLGLLMIQDPDMMFLQTTRDLYKSLLQAEETKDSLKAQVMQNLQNYLQTEDAKQQEAAMGVLQKQQDPESDEEIDMKNELAGENIKEICDVSSGMSSSVMQLFLKQILEAFFHISPKIRRNALHTVTLTLQLGLVHPNQCVSYLIAATSDREPTIYKEADQQLGEIGKKYSGFITSNANQGINMSYKLQKIINNKNKIVARGFTLVQQITTLDENAGYNKACCSHLYQLVRSDRKHRRSLINSLLRLFDDTVMTDMGKLIFIADNLAYFPYQTVDEPLFLMNAIEVFVSVSGSNVIQALKEELNACKQQVGVGSSVIASSDDESDVDEEKANNDVMRRELSRMSEQVLLEFSHHSLACLLLLWLKDFLKCVFGFTDKKIHKYNPMEKNRANDKQCHRKIKLEQKYNINIKPAEDHIIRLQNNVNIKSTTSLHAIHRQYCMLKELMNKLDPNEEDSSGDELNKTTTQPQSSQQNNQDSSSDTDNGESKQKTSLDLIRKSTALKSRPKSGRKVGSNKVKYAEESSSGSESDEDFRGL